MAIAHSARPRRVCAAAVPMIFSDPAITEMGNAVRVVAEITS